MRYHDSEATLPAVAAVVNERNNADTLLLTLVFHPDASRIGQCAVLPLADCYTPRELGRNSPEFSGAAAPAAPIGDPHVSRRALQFEVCGQRLRLRRHEGASRCRVGDEDLFEETLIEPAHLARGVPIMLSHSVVLLLRSVRRPRIPAQYAASAAGLLGVSCSMQALRADIARVAQTDVDVLIRGETGSGKELVARALHAASARNGAPLVSVNIAAIPAELAAVALFGSTRGAFTGAERATPGFFRQAQGGSLFLDEIGDTASSVQPQLLRALQQREIQPVGGSVERVDVRVISATDVSLDESGSDFRAALRHRLGACEIVVPPLRDHPEDIGVLLLHFLRLAAQEGDLALPLTNAHMQPQLVAAWAGVFFRLLGYAWPGNVREL
ncbi:MAG: sigma-54-dependent Fis family transcriptional regulator, partial [Halioglobus sp.]|nr:sigma-54-dependent Fis family transcriptional regulator [Halioglobus sp.]